MQYSTRMHGKRVRACRLCSEPEGDDFQHLLRCIVESDVGTFRRVCRCSMWTCPWDDIAFVMDRSEVVQFASCSSLRANNNVTALARPVL